MTKQRATAIAETIARVGLESARLRWLATLNENAGERQMFLNGVAERLEASVADLERAMCE